MGRISAFVFTSLDGYYKGFNEDTSWHNHGEEELQYSEESLALGDALLFGRVTYEHMQSFWPTPAAAQLMPKMAEGMNSASKLVVSRTLKEPGWKNTQVLGTNWAWNLGRPGNPRTSPCLAAGRF